MATKAKTAAAQDEPQAPEYPLPAEYENQSVGFQRAFAHAKANGNPDKSSLLFAEAHAYEYEETGEGDV